jgi:hypothetical protein
VEQNLNVAVGKISQCFLPLLTDDYSAFSIPEVLQITVGCVLSLKEYLVSHYRKYKFSMSKLVMKLSKQCSIIHIGQLGQVDTPSYQLLLSHRK